MLTLTKRELVEMIYRPQVDMPAGFIDSLMRIGNNELCNMASKSMRVSVEYIGSGLFMTKYYGN